MKSLLSIVVVTAGLAMTLIVGCAKPPAEEPLAAQANRDTTQPNANVQDLTGTPLYASTVRGDVERAGLAVAMAHDYAKQQSWFDSVAQLRAALSQIEKALERKPRLKDDFEAARAALIKTIESVEGRGADMEARFTEIQTRINALKVYTSQ